MGIRKSLVEFPNGDCVFFHGESRTCQVYPVRPRQCRTWPFWNSDLSSPKHGSKPRNIGPVAIAARWSAGEDRGAADMIPV